MRKKGLARFTTYHNILKYMQNKNIVENIYREYEHYGYNKICEIDILSQIDIFKMHRELANDNKY